MYIVYIYIESGLVDVNINFMKRNHPNSGWIMTFVISVVMSPPRKICTKQYCPIQPPCLIQTYYPIVLSMTQHGCMCTYIYIYMVLHGQGYICPYPAVIFEQNLRWVKGEAEESNPLKNQRHQFSKSQKTGCFLISIIPGWYQGVRSCKKSLEMNWRWIEVYLQKNPA